MIVVTQRKEETRHNYLLRAVIISLNYTGNHEKIIEFEGLITSHKELAKQVEIWFDVV